MTGKPMKLPKQPFHTLNSRLAALGPAFAPYRGDPRLWAPQKLSVQGYHAGLMDTGRDAVSFSARALQSEELFLLPGCHCVPLMEVLNVSAEPRSCPGQLFQVE